MEATQAPDVFAVDSDDLGGILRMRRGLTCVDGQIALVADGPPIDELVEASVLRALVSVATTPEEALACVADGSAR